jgi:hypothetical protein
MEEEKRFIEEESDLLASWREAVTRGLIAPFALILDQVPGRRDSEPPLSVMEQQ